MDSEQSLLEYKAQLQRLGFQILQLEPEIESQTIIASRHSFYWDCLFTFINYTIFIRRLDHLSAAIIASDRPLLICKSTSINPSFLPRGLQSGNAILVVYIADHVDADAQIMCEQNVRSGIAEFYVPAALDVNRKSIFIFKKVPFWGSLYYAKFRYILTRLLSPRSKLSPEPLSKSGILVVLLVLVPMVLIVVLALIFRF